MSSKGHGPLESPEGKSASRPKLVKPAGPLPASTVLSRHGNELISRGSRGFSKGEVMGAGLPFHQARRWGLPMDTRRRSVLEGNVATLKNWASLAKPAERREGEAKKIEEVIVKVEKEVKKEVKKEAAKVKKEVKKEAKKVEKVEKAAAKKVKAQVKKRTQKKSAPKKKKR